ncbi:ricin b lectin [Plakobranchus ocellatus]|uniref:Ricin b lectin n=1 Tax=Plakobranchus ocellatus TaxID=259542 RepID=A0AAV4C417_9GAST|nr:ricin b lectin [Plakobranchus ocellatus]
MISYSQPSIFLTLPSIESNMKTIKACSVGGFYLDEPTYIESCTPSYEIDSSPVEPEPEESVLCLYQHPNYKGNKKCFDEEEINHSKDMTSPKFPHLMANYGLVDSSSLTIKSGYRATVGTRGAAGSYIGEKKFRSNVEGIVLEGTFMVGGVAGVNNEIIFNQFKKPTYGNNQNISGTFNQPMFNVIKSGEIQNASSVTLNLATQYNLASFIYNTGGSAYVSPSSVPNSQQIPVYNASCNVTHPTNVEVPALVKGVRDEVSSYFNIALNCADKSVMQNNVQLTVTPVNMTNVSLSLDKSSLLYNGNGQIVLMNIFNNLGSESQMLFSTMYEFSNDAQGNSFTIPMRAKFQLGSSSGYGNFSFQTQITVRYN